MFEDQRVVQPRAGAFIGQALTQFVDGRVVAEVPHVPGEHQRRTYQQRHAQHTVQGDEDEILLDIRAVAIDERVAEQHYRGDHHLAKAREKSQ